MGYRSSVLIVILVFALLFGLLYASNTTDASHVPTDFRVSELQAIEIVEQDAKSRLEGLTDISLYWYQYNYTKYEARPSKPVPFSEVKQQPELLSLVAMYMHSNGTLYIIDPDSQEVSSFKCHTPDRGCFTTHEETLKAINGKFFYRIEIVWYTLDDDSKRSSHFAYYYVDARTGEVIYVNRYLD